MGNIQITGSKGTPLYPEQGYKVYANTNFQVGSSPVVYDVLTDLGRVGIKGWITCDGTGSIIVQISDDGTNYGDAYTLKNGETELFKGDERINKIKITHSGVDSSYRIRVT